MKKLNELVSDCAVTAYGFPAFRALTERSNESGDTVTVATDSPAIMADRDICVYYSPVLTPGTVFNDVDQVLAANLDCQLVTVMQYPDWDLINNDKIAIVSNNQGTIDHLKGVYPDATVLSGRLSPDDIKGLHIIGTMPPHLVQYCQSYRAVTIRDFDWSKDASLSGQELVDRLIISDPITVIID